MTPISIQYRLTESEFMAVCYANWTVQGSRPQWDIMVGVVFCVIGLSTLIAHFLLGLFIIGCGAILLSIVLIRSFLWRKAFRDTPKYNEPISIVFQQDMIYVKTIQGESYLNWNTYAWYLDTSHFVLLYMTKKYFSVIPKAAFQDQAQIKTFLDLIQSKLKPYS
ncbi:YcxB family protein [Candidatus Albibeggiatoa sp. nov. BB20]|uniref:YcxB family protein n=1 Tax=Candidatus Albibeggiatoa sp. nov. BB20 TaxID=3162723 RepID=UPI003365AA50